MTGRAFAYVEGLVAPYFGMAEISERDTAATRELFARGAFAQSWKNPNDIVLELHHDRVLGVATELDDLDAGLWGRFRLADSPLTRKAMEDVEAGRLRFFSPRFLPLVSRTAMDGMTVIRERCRLRAVSLTDNPAYKTTAVMGFERFRVEQKREAAMSYRDDGGRSLRRLAAEMERG